MDVTIENIMHNLMALSFNLLLGRGHSRTRESVVEGIKSDQTKCPNDSAVFSMVFVRKATDCVPLLANQFRELGEVRGTFHSLILKATKVEISFIVVTRVEVFLLGVYYTRDGLLWYCLGCWSQWFVHSIRFLIFRFCIVHQESVENIIDSYSNSAFFFQPPCQRKPLFCMLSCLQEKKKKYNLIRNLFTRNKYKAIQSRMRTCTVQHLIL